MRYFLFFWYATQNNPGGFKDRTGQITMSKDVFPNHQELNRLIADHFKITSFDIVLTGVHEFKSEEDYKSFRGED